MPPDPTQRARPKSVGRMRQNRQQNKIRTLNLRLPPQLRPQPCPLARVASLPALAIPVHGTRSAWATTSSENIGKRTTTPSRLEREAGDILKRIRNEYDEDLRREKLLGAEYAAQRGVVTGEGEKAIKYNILKREVESSRQLYDAMFSN